MVYFLYSHEQVQEKNKILAKCGKTFVPGTISFHGQRYKFSQISDKPTMDRFVDTKLIASFNNLSEATYVPTKTTAVRGDN